MYRQFLLKLLARYQRRYPEDAHHGQAIEQFVRAHPDCFLRSCLRGHVTASAWILSVDQQRCLLVYHRKLQRWLQPGGHADGEPEVHRTALREAEEETGLWRLALHVERDGSVLPFDLDVHAIPARPTEPEHKHYDVRFLLRATHDDAPRASTDAVEARWVPLPQVEELTRETSILRMVRRTAAFV